MRYSTPTHFICAIIATEKYGVFLKRVPTACKSRAKVVVIQLNTRKYTEEKFLW